MASKFALELLIDAVQAQVVADWGNPEAVTVVFGQKEPRKNINVGTVGRIVFADGDPDGDYGEIGGAKQWEHPAEALFNLDHVFRVYVFAHDVSKAEDELAQYHAGLVVLFELIRAIYRATHQAIPVTSPVAFSRPKRIKPEAQHSSGIEYLLLASIEQPILDIFDDQLEFTRVFPDAQGTEEHNGQTETFNVRKAT